MLENPEKYSTVHYKIKAPGRVKELLQQKNSDFYVVQPVTHVAIR
jgi:hypothetical protein